MPSQRRAHRSSSQWCCSRPYLQYLNDRPFGSLAIEMEACMHGDLKSLSFGSSFRGLQLVLYKCRAKVMRLAKPGFQTYIHHKSSSPAEPVSMGHGLGTNLLTLLLLLLPQLLLLTYLSSGFESPREAKRLGVYTLDHAGFLLPAPGQGWVFVLQFSFTVKAHT